MKVKKDRRSNRVASDDGLGCNVKDVRRVREFYLGFLSEYLPHEAFDKARNVSLNIVLEAIKDVQPNVLLSGAATILPGNAAPSHRVRSN